MCDLLGNSEWLETSPFHDDYLSDWEELSPYDDDYIREEYRDEELL